MKTAYNKTDFEKCSRFSYSEFIFRFNLLEETGGGIDIVYCDEVNIRLENGVSYGDLVSAIIEHKYSKDAELALLNNYISDPEKYADEYAKYQEWRKYAKECGRIIFPKEATLEEAKEDKIAEINIYDKSTSVNEFTLYGTPMWLDKSTRVGLVNAVNSAKVLGQETVTLGLGGHTYTLPCDTALAMLASLEMYALACYNVTLSHKNAVKALETIEAVEAYDYKAGYPEKLVFE